MASKTHPMRLRGDNPQQADQPADVPPAPKLQHEASEASDSSKDICGQHTPEYILRWSWWIDNFNYLTLAFFPHVMPSLTLYYQYQTGTWLTWLQVLQLFLVGYWKLVMTFCIVHRFFAHKTYSASRPVAFVLGILAASSAQRGPVWWGSKHVRHHKFCENEGDPHSAARTNMAYAYIGWTLMPYEKRIDWAFVHKHFKVPEMLVVEAISNFVPFIEVFIAYKLFGVHAAIMDVYFTAIAVYLTLLFNVGLHHDPEVPNDAMAHGRYVCKAHNKLPFLLRYGLDFMGEMDHHDHHRYPRKAFHPSNIGVDASYWLIIYPMQALGLIYDVNMDGRYRSKDE